MFGLTERLSPANADRYYDVIAEALQRPEFRPRALFEKFNIEVIATTESALDDLRWHKAIRESGWQGRVVTNYRPDSVVDPAFPGFRDNVASLGAIAGEDATTWSGYLSAHRKRRDFFKAHGATATDHGHPSAATANLAPADARALFARVIAGTPSEADSELFRAQMLTEMAAMSLDDGLVMQIHPGSWRNHNPLLYARFGRDKGADIPIQTDYVHALKPLLDRFGNEKSLTGPLPGFAVGAAVVVLRFGQRHAPLSRVDNRNRRLRQHGRLQRRHASLSLDPRPPRRGAARRLCVPRRTRRHASAR